MPTCNFERLRVGIVICFSLEIGQSSKSEINHLFFLGKPL